MKTNFTLSNSSETTRLLLFLTKKFTRITFRWTLYAATGVLAWLLFDPLPASFLWFTLVMMMGAMSIHSVLHHKSLASPLVRQVCRYAFFLSFPMLFMFAGNRLAVWSVAGETNASIEAPGLERVESIVASEEYLMLKELQKEQFKDPAKAKKTVKKFLGKQLAKAKKMDSATRTILIIIGAILLLIIILLVALLIAFSNSVDSCLGSDNDNDGCLS